MFHLKHPFLIACSVIGLAGCAGATGSAPEKTAATTEVSDTSAPAPAHATYFVNPVSGDDAGAGVTAEKPWRSFAKLNAIKLAPGDKVVVAPGVHTTTLMPQAQGTAEAPVVIEFLPGTHEFAVEKAERRPYFVSNSCDAPTVPKPVAILVENCRHLRLLGAGVEAPAKTLILMGGRMIEAVNDRSEDIAYSKLVFDLKRPTVSEYRVLETTANTAVVQIAEGSDYAVENGKLVWKGDIGFGGTGDQDSIPAEGLAWRIWGQQPLNGAVAQDLGDRRVRLTYPKGGTGDLVVGHQIQSRRHLRDSVGVFTARSKDIAFEDCDFYALTNMGMVSQFTENITLRRVRVAPPKGTIRTCPAWADVFQFSNCRGAVLVEDCVGSGMQDDFVNCHGTYLRIVGKPADDAFTLRYMEPMTYGFPPFVAGDELAVVDHNKLRELPANPRRKVIACRQSDKAGKEWLVTLDGPAPAFATDDVVDNFTWHPDLTLRRNKVDMAPIHGFCIGTCGKVLIEDNTLQSKFPGVCSGGDARGSFESTGARDLTIRNNRFVGCGIEFAPSTTSNDPKESVLENIRIENNTIDGGSIEAKNVKSLTITGNRTTTGGKVPLLIEPSCSEVKAD